MKKKAILITMLSAITILVVGCGMKVTEHNESGTSNQKIKSSEVAIHATIDGDPRDQGKYTYFNLKDAKYIDNDESPEFQELIIIMDNEDIKDKFLDKDEVEIFIDKNAPQTMSLPPQINGNVIQHLEK